MTTTVDLAHRPDCTDPRAGRPFRGQRGDLLVRCRACGAMQLVPEATESSDEREPEAVSRWWCRAHLLPCDWRGRGCPECQREHESEQRTTEPRET